MLSLDAAHRIYSEKNLWKEKQKVKNKIIKIYISFEALNDMMMEWMIMEPKVITKRELDIHVWCSDRLLWIGLMSEDI